MKYEDLNVDIIDTNQGNSRICNPSFIFYMTKNPHYIVKPFVMNSMARSLDPYSIDSYVEKYVGVMVFLRGSSEEHYGFTIRLKEKTWT